MNVLGAQCAFAGQQLWWYCMVAWAPINGIIAFAAFSLQNVSSAPLYTSVQNTSVDSSGAI
jgi:hypothetical protein